MQNRETIEFKAPNGATLILKSYITARERRQINSAMVGAIGSNEDSTEGQLNAVNASQNESLKIMIVSIDGKKDGETTEENKPFSVLEYLLDLRDKDFKAILAKVDEILAQDNEKKTI